VGLLYMQYYTADNIDAIERHILSAILLRAKTTYAPDPNPALDLFAKRMLVDSDGNVDSADIILLSPLPMQKLGGDLSGALLLAVPLGPPHARLRLAKLLHASVAPSN